MTFDELKQHGKEIKAELSSLQYNTQPLIQLPETELKYEWSVDKDSSGIKELEQEIEVEGQFELKAKYNHQKNVTKIKSESAEEKESEQTLPGLVILKLLTKSGTLSAILE